LFVVGRRRVPLQVIDRRGPTKHQKTLKIP
jgi:hypothetical protein